jgi:hypothetical protein
LEEVLQGRELRFEFAQAQVGGAGGQPSRSGGFLQREGDFS